MKSCYKVKSYQYLLIKGYRVICSLESLIGRLFTPAFLANPLIHLRELFFRPHRNACVHALPQLSEQPLVGLKNVGNAATPTHRTKMFGKAI